MRLIYKAENHTVMAGKNSGMFRFPTHLSIYPGLQCTEEGLLEEPPALVLDRPILTPPIKNHKDRCSAIFWES